MIFYFSGVTSGADPEREMGEDATIMLSFHIAYADGSNNKRRNRKKTLKPDKRFRLVYEARKAKADGKRKS